MKNRMIFSILLGLLSLCGVVKAQTNYEFTYDAAGNRTRRALVIIGKGEHPDDTEGRSSALVSQVLETDDGVKLYPNPTKGEIRLETPGSDAIGFYLLSDSFGRTLETGKDKGPTLLLDLSRHPNGVYLLETIVGGKTTYYKIIKQ